MRQSFAFLLFANVMAAGGALAAEALKPEPCCVLHMTPQAVDTINAALLSAPIPANTTVPIVNDITAQARAQVKASEDWDEAHKPKPAK